MSPIDHRPGNVCISTANTFWCRTKDHLINIASHIGVYKMECSTRLNKCGTWFCARTNNNNNNNMTLFNSGNNELNGPKPIPFTSEIVQGPGPSPGSSGSCDESEPPPKNCYRLVMLGSARVGKTSLVSRFLGGKFEESYTPTIEDFHRKLYRIRSEVHQLDILDTSGNHPFPAMRRLSFLTGETFNETISRFASLEHVGAVCAQEFLIVVVIRDLIASQRIGDIFVLVFSMDSRESFEEVVRLREQILETKWSALSGSGGRSKKNLPKVPMVIAGNKCDREMKTVQTEEVLAYCSGQDACCVFVECSAKKNIRVDDMFYELFLAANLPLEMAPNHHKRVSTAFGSPCTLPPPHTASNRSKKCTLSIKRRLSDACGVVAPNVRRPSIRTDLMIMRSKTCSLGEGGGSDAASFGFMGRNAGGCVLQ